MGGQACVLYGGAEFSRDCDIVIIADDLNLSRLNDALEQLEAKCIAIPPFETQYLDRGHAVHFRCGHKDALNMRLDVMSRLRGCDDFETMWCRRTTIEDLDGLSIDVMAIEDLVSAKKTQRDKDWPMITRLVDAHFDQNQHEPNEDRIRFWLFELRNPKTLIDISCQHPVIASQLSEQRTLLRHAIEGNIERIEAELNIEVQKEMLADKQYWDPLKRELESLRAMRKRSND